VNTHGADATMKALLKRRNDLAHFFSSVFIEQTALAAKKFAARFGLSKYENPTYSCGSDPERTRQAVESVQHSLAIANQLVTQAGGKFYMILQPTSYIGSARTDRVRQDMAAQGEHVKEAFDAYYGLFRERMTASKVAWWRDYSDAFNGDEYIYVDAHHVSPNGNAIIAKRVKELLASPAPTGSPG
jgi:hypothetical protein